MQTVPLFPVYFAKDQAPDGLITEDITKFIEQIPRKNNTLNGVSKDNYVLERYPELSHIKSWLQNQINNVFKNDFAADPRRIKPVITQSWFTYSKRGEAMHGHTHPNSILSGVLYIRANKDLDVLKLGRPHQEKMMKWYYTHLGEFTAAEYLESVGTGDFVLFQSDLHHEFGEVEHDDVRISLAFNTFAEGYWGDDDLLTGLHIKYDYPG